MKKRWQGSDLYHASYIVYTYVCMCVCIKPVSNPCTSMTNTHVSLSGLYVFLPSFLSSLLCTAACAPSTVLKAIVIRTVSLHRRPHRKVHGFISYSSTFIHGKHMIVKCSFPLALHS